MVDAKGSFVVKLPREKVDALIESRAAVRFDPAGRLMKEWAALEPHAGEVAGAGSRAMRFVARRNDGWRYRITLTVARYSSG
jgi:hypothetical protein